MMRICLLACVAFTVSRPSLGAAQNAWQPSVGHAQIPIWPGAIPNARPMNGPEMSDTVRDNGRPRLVGGAPWVYVDRVAQPTITVYSPTVRNTGAAVIVFPGGGYNVLAIDLEGTEACDWLTARGVTCVLLKYRVPCAKTGRYNDCLTALQDAQRALGLVRLRAAEWHIDPHKIGVLGFSAGGHMVAAISTHFDKRLYAPVDAADSVSCRPDFAIALYPGHLAERAKDSTMNPDIRVTSRTPPTLLVQAEDDPVDPVENSLVYHAALRKAGVPVEMHLFTTGRHAFGMRRTSSPITAWPELAENWMRAIGMIPSNAPPVMTDSLAYHLRRRPGGWDATAVATYVNRSGVPVYYHRCRPEDNFPRYEMRRVGPDSTRTAFLGFVELCFAGVSKGVVAPGDTLRLRVSLMSTDSPGANPPILPEHRVGRFVIDLWLCDTPRVDSGECRMLQRDERESNVFEIRY